MKTQRPSRRNLARAACFVALLAACDTDPHEPSQATGSELPAPDAGEVDATVEAPAATDSCGDGVVTGAEGCEPPGSVECDESCQPRVATSVGVCGDAVLDLGEECDDGNLESVDGCSFACRTEACGNARVDPGEGCDHPGETCSATCQNVDLVLPNCGDSTVQAPEQCDDGNLQSADGCSDNCQLEVCGNSHLDQLPALSGAPSVEACDPPEAGYCDDTCQLILCGDGKRAPSEGCDDGNVLGGDGCSPRCAPESCGDGSVNQAVGLEQCEPPGSASCDEHCLRIACGNGTKQGTEECDDGNLLPGDGCNEVCAREACGNGKLEPNEDCEPPSVGRCGAQCRSIRVDCGDGLKTGDEECDDGNLAFGDGCSSSCLNEACGNGRVEAPRESCEPPGTASCTAKCQRPRCGDGSLDRLAGEECEDGNSNAGDGCSASCTEERCGNGRVDIGEQCEPPGTPSCGPACQLPPGSSLSGTPLGPLDAARFQLVNPAFDGSLDPWQKFQGAPAVVQFSAVDLAGANTSGSAQLSLNASAAVNASQSPVNLLVSLPDASASEGASAGVAQCVRTSEGVTYQLSTSARLTAQNLTPVFLELGTSFHAGSACAGESIGSVSTVYELDDSGDWEGLQLPPPSPISGFDSSFEVPEGAGSMNVWMVVAAEDGASPYSALLDGVELARVSAAVCGNGVPEGAEECEPSVTPGCSPACKLPLVCGDGLIAQGECAGAGACVADCNRIPRVCGDNVVTPPEECDPGGQGACKTNCTLPHGLCGNGVREDAEECDPPNGASCSSDCKSIACGDGVVESPEECDPPRTASCNAHCRKLEVQAGRCGDGYLQGAEECDPPNLQTWCSTSCKRRNPALACGDGSIDVDLGENCDPPGFASNCGSDCRRPQCGDGKVGGAEQCDPPNEKTCGLDCNFSGTGVQCQQCLAQTCGDLFGSCFGLDGVALAGPAAGTPLRQLCADAVACMQKTGCAGEKRESVDATPMACYCGKSVLVPVLEGASDRIRACRDGALDAQGGCRAEFERAAESLLPGSVLAALGTGLTKTALGAAVRAMSECGHVEGKCQTQCTTTSDCGNGVLEPGELCDPGPSDDPVLKRTCVTDNDVCAILPCGNGRVDVTWPYGPSGKEEDLKDYAQPAGWRPETCDILDPYTNQGGKCDKDCQLVVACGDGKLTASVEACDPGPDGDWSDCCMPDELPNGTAPNNAGQRAGCDQNKDNKIGREEQCKSPQTCHNGKREGAEECDPGPADTADCEACKSVDACTKCTRDIATTVPGSPDVYAFCYGDLVDPALRKGCFEVLDCIKETACAAEGDYRVCYCGERLPNPKAEPIPLGDLGTCASLGGLNGSCQALIAENMGCAINDGQCVSREGQNQRTPGGAAFRTVFARQQYGCADECGYWAPTPSADE